MQFLMSEKDLPKQGHNEEEGGPWEDWRSAEKGRDIISKAQFRDVKSWTSIHNAAFPNITNIWDTIVTSPMTDVSHKSPEFINSAFEKFQESIKVRLGFEKIEDIDNRLLLLVNASNIYTGHK